MALCDSKLFFSRDVKVYIEPLDAAGDPQGQVWEIPVLDGFSFAQANNSSEISLQEMESAGGISRRGTRKFNDSLAPAEWSLSTYIRPFVSAGGVIGTAGKADSTTNVHAVEEILWALMAGKAERSGAGWLSGGNSYFTLGASGTGTNIDFEWSNTSSLGTANIYFVLEKAGLTYKVAKAVVNEATINFDIDGIAMIEWSGMGSEIVDGTGQLPDISAASTVFINEDVTETDNFIRNRLTSLTVKPVKNPVISVAAISGGSWTTGVATITYAGANLQDGVGLTYFIPGGNNDAVLTYTIAGGVCTAASITTVGSGYIDDTGPVVVPGFGPSSYNYPADTSVLQDAYNLTLTGGSITISNNISYITPEELGIVNIPIGHVTGNRAISGTINNYLVFEPGQVNQSVNLWNDAKALSTVVTHTFNLVFSVGGSGNFPKLDIEMPYCHIEIPTHSIEDVISLETNFSALGECISSADEINLTYDAA